jgi:hypothetical protein
MSFCRAKKSAHVFRQSAVFLPADLAVPCPKTPLRCRPSQARPFGLVPSIVIAELAVVDVESRRAYALPRRSEPAAPLPAPITRRPGVSFYLRVGCLLAKSGLRGTCTIRTRKASRMNTCAKRVGGWWPRTTLARKGYLLRRSVYQQDELSPVKRVALFAAEEESGASRPKDVPGG